VTGRPSIEQDFGVSVKGMGLQSAGRAFRRTDVNENRHAALPCPRVEDCQKASRTSGKSLAHSRKTQQPPGKTFPLFTRIDLLFNQFLESLIENIGLVGHGVQNFAESVEAKRV